MKVTNISPSLEIKIMENKTQIKLLYSKDWKDYELLDTGEREKLEHVGPYTFVRPSESEVWSKTLPKADWDKADGRFWSSKAGAKPGWQLNPNLRHSVDVKKEKDLKWGMEYKGIRFLASPTSFRHLGFFPEQASHWDFIEKKILARTVLAKDKPVKFLNLFGYTGLASLFALRGGAEVTHVDASKQTLNWAKENQNLNKDLADGPMRVIEDDVMKFLEREIKRGNKYDAVIMDPPKFGRGPKGEVWKLEEMLPVLLAQVKKVLSDDPLFVILTSYSTDASALTLGYALEETTKDLKGNIEVGEMCVLEKSNNRLISLAHTAVWQNS